MSSLVSFLLQESVMDIILSHPQNCRKLFLRSLDQD